VCVCVCVCVCVYSCLSCPVRQSNIFCNLHCTVTSVACPVLLYFFTLFHKRHYFRETKFLQHKMCILIFSTIFSEPFVILRKMQRDCITKCKEVFTSSTSHSCHCNNFNQNWTSSTDFSRIHKYHISWKSVHLAASCFMRIHELTNWQHGENNSRFSQFCNRPYKKCLMTSYIR